MKWSYSAHRTMRRCQRQFAFEYLVASHKSSDPLRREAYLLRQLQTPSLWQGDIVHRILAQELPRLLQRKGKIVPAQLTDAALGLMRRQLAFSADRRYRLEGQTKTAAGDGYCALVAHERGEGVAAAHLQEVERSIATCFENLAAADTFVQALQAGSNHRFEQMVSFSLNDMTVSARLDLIFGDPSGRATVVDWKVAASETSDYSLQLLTYALALVRCKFLPYTDPDQIDLVEFNLLKGEIRRHPLDCDRLDQIEDMVYRSIVDMKALCGRGRYAELELDEFEVARQPGTCALCKYSTLCIESLVASAQTEQAELIQGRLL